MGHAFYCVLFISIFVLLQLFAVFKILSVPHSRKKVFWLIVVYTAVFRGIDYITAGPAETSLQMYIANLLFHAVDTFILLAIVGIFAESYLPRNFILLTFYYDLLTVAMASLFLNDLFMLLPLDDIDLSSSVYTAHTPQDILLFVPWVMQIGIIVIAALLFNRKLRNLTAKIHDRVWLLIFVVGFIYFILHDAIAVYLYEPLFDPEVPVIVSSLYDACIITAGLMTATLLLLLNYARSKQRYQQLLCLEADLQYDYYRNVAQVHQDIRTLRHDLSNHLTAMHTANEYAAALLKLCDQIEARTDEETRWQLFQTSLLSNREKYELYQYIRFLTKKFEISIDDLSIEIIDDLSIETDDDLSIETAAAGGETVLSIGFPARCARRMHPLLLKRNLLYRLMSAIAAAHGGSASWEKGEDACTFYIRLQRSS